MICIHVVFTKEEGGIFSSGLDVPIYNLYLVVEDFSIGTPSSGYDMEEQKNFCVIVGTWD